MPRTKEQFEAMRKASREKIVSAAVNVFAQKGFAAANVQDIADDAEISVGLLYRHFKTKDEIFGSILGEALAGYKEIGRLFERDASPIEVLGQFVDEVLHDLENSAEFVQMVLLLTQPFLSNLDFPWMADLFRGNREMEYGLAGLIAKGQQAGEFAQGDPTQMAQHFLSCVQGMCVSAHVLKEKYMPPTREMMMGFLLNPQD